MKCFPPFLRCFYLVYAGIIADGTFLHQDSLYKVLVLRAYMLKVRSLYPFVIMPKIAAHDFKHQKCARCHAGITGIFAVPVIPPVNCFYTLNISDLRTCSGLLGSTDKLLPLSAHVRAKRGGGVCGKTDMKWNRRGFLIRNTESPISIGALSSLESYWVHFSGKNFHPFFEHLIMANHNQHVLI